MPNQPTQIEAYEKSVFTAPTKNGYSITHDIYTRGNGKKIVVIIQELPGIGQETLALADRFINRNFKVVLPHLFGPIGKVNMLGNFLRVLCMRKEFHLFASNRSSPIVDWLKALCQKIKADNQVNGVATIGMCLTGNFAISLMADEAVLASFASQPSLPVNNKNSLHMSDHEIEMVKKRIDQVGSMHCGRFEGDKHCTAHRFDSIQKKFNTDGKERIVLHTLPGDGHSILTLDFVDKTGHPTRKALEEVIGYFEETLEG